MRERTVVRDYVMEAPVEAAWSVIAQTQRINEAVGSAEFEVTEETRPDGSVRRTGRGRLLPPFQCEWEESFGEWVMPRLISQRRAFTRGPLKSLLVKIELAADGERTLARSTMHATWTTWTTGLIAALGVLDKELDKRNRAAIEAAEQAREGQQAWSLVEPAPLSAEARSRLADCRQKLVERGQPTELIELFIEHLRTSPFDVARRVRPLSLARAWGVSAEAVVGLCLEANRIGLVSLGWDLLCPRCRGAKLRTETLHGLPTQTHCSSCNVDYGRDFARNVELSFRPERWLRTLPDGEFCLQGAGSTPHVLMQRLVEPGTTATIPVDLPAGQYRIRTVEPGGEVDAEVTEPSQGLPAVMASETALTATPQQAAGTFCFHNGTRRLLHAVLEDRAWASDALTGERVIAMPMFRELCPEQVLRVGDEVEIGRVALLFSDLKGSTELYERIGDSAAYAMVREHFGLLSETVRELNGVLVKTMGDAVMAAFYEPADAARAALEISRRIATYNAAHPDRTISLKLGLHGGRCIAVTTAGALDYFGGTVNLTARLEAQSYGDDIVVSRDLAEDAGVRAVFSGLEAEAGRAMLRGFAEPVPFVRVKPGAARPTSDS